MDTLSTQDPADMIAIQITKILIESFIKKENRQPTNDEIDDLMNELTEERVAKLMGDSVVLDGEDADGEDSEEDSHKDENEEEEDTNQFHPIPIVTVEPVKDKVAEVENSENVRLNEDLISDKRQKLEI